jgi:hypothetical protein
LPVRSVCRWRLEGDRPRPIVSLVFEARPASGSVLVFQKVRVDAVVGLLVPRSRRFE